MDDDDHIDGGGPDQVPAFDDQSVSEFDPQGAHTPPGTPPGSPSSQGGDDQFEESESAYVAPEHDDYGPMDLTSNRDEAESDDEAPPKPRPSHHTRPVVPQVPIYLPFKKKKKKNFIALAS